MAQQFRINVGEGILLGGNFWITPKVSYTGVVASSFSVTITMGYSFMTYYFPMDMKEITLDKLKLRVIEVNPYFIIVEK